MLSNQASNEWLSVSPHANQVERMICFQMLRFFHPFSSKVLAMIESGGLHIGDHDEM